MKPQDPREAWIVAAVSARWPGSRVEAIMPLKGDASSRQFWRVDLDCGNTNSPSEVPATAIAIDLGPDDLPLYARTLNLMPESPLEPPWINVHRFLRLIGSPVPELYSADVSARMMVVEDVGDIPLFDAAVGGKTADLYRLATDELLRFHIDGTARLDGNCIAARIAYDERLFRWELEQFAQFGIGETAPGASRNALTPELDDLAARLGQLPRVFSHRDYHGNNLFVQRAIDGEPRIRIIDFQDALMAPAAQDLAVLLTTRDTVRIITPAIERRVLDYYYAATIRRRCAQLSFSEFIESYRLCVLQHALKVIGRFIFLEREGKRGYGVYIPYALAQARRMLAQGNDFPRLRAALGH